MIESEFARGLVEKRWERLYVLPELSDEAFDTELAMGAMCVGTDVRGPVLAADLEQERAVLVRLLLDAGPCDCPGSEPMRLNCRAQSLVTGALAYVFWLGYEHGRAEA